MIVIVLLVPLGATLTRLETAITLPLASAISTDASAPGAQLSAAEMLYVNPPPEEVPFLFKRTAI